MNPAAFSASIAALRDSIKTLEAHVDLLGPWLRFWMALVVVGVVLEILFILWEHWEAREAYRHGGVSPAREPSVKRLLFEMLGAVLVVVGVAGEFGVDVKTSALQGSLRNQNGKLSQLLEGGASSALLNAATLEKANRLLAIELESERQETTRKATELTVAQEKLAEAKAASDTATAHFIAGRQPDPYPFRALGSPRGRRLICFSRKRTAKHIPSLRGSLAGCGLSVGV